MRQRLVVGPGRQRVPSAGDTASRLIPAQHLDEDVNLAWSGINVLFA